MRVLFVCHRFPYPPSRGGKIRPFNIIRHLSERGDQVTVASLARSADEAQQGAGLARYCHEYLLARVDERAAFARMILRLPTSTPSSMGYFHSGTLARDIERVVGARSFDLALVHCSSVAHYVARFTGLPKLLDFGDMDSQKWLSFREWKAFPLSLGYWLEGTKLQRAEARLAARFDLNTCTTRAEYESLNEIAPGCESGWFPNGVDHALFAPDGTGHEPDLVSFVGRMDYFPNQQGVRRFCEEVVPRLRALHASARLQIVGAEPPASIRALGRLEGVTVTGSVPDVRPYVRRSALTVAPLTIARGTQNKVLESLALGVPVVASPQAAGGVDAVAGEHLLVAGTADEMAARIHEVMTDRALRTRLSEAGRARMLSNHSWPQSMRRLDGLLERFRSRPETRADARESAAMASV